jgi:hypothetical protein
MVFSMSEFKRPRHRLVMQALAALDADFLAHAKCYFGGGARIALALAEYRESADIDLLCADRAGYRALRSTVTDKSLGRIVRVPMVLAREVIADRYGIRTFVQAGTEKIKFEIVSEGRIGITGSVEPGCPIPVLTPVSCFAEKFLANADRWNDESFLGRDVIDLAFMAAAWDPADAAAGLAQARDAYGKVVDLALKKAVLAMSERKDYMKRCTTGLGVEDTRTLARGLRTLSVVSTRTRARSGR